MDIFQQKLTVEGFIAKSGNKYPLLAEFKNTEQDPDWHSEGNVQIHTDMVIDEAYQIADEYNLTEKRAKILIYAALFHDYGKPLTTQEVEIKDKIRIGAPRHEEIGASLLFFLDPPSELSQDEWLEVIQLVAYHHIPKKLVVKDAKASEYAKLTRRVLDIELLYLLEVADMTGRTCSDKQDQLDIMEMFKLCAIEHGIWGENPYSDNLAMVKSEFPDYEFPERIAEQMASRYEDGQIFMLEEELQRAYNYISSQSHLVVLCGLPGCGKSTYTKEHFEGKGYEVISLDSIRENHFGSRAKQCSNDEVVRIAHQELKVLLRERKNIIWDATNFRKDFRSKICQLGFDYKAFVDLRVFHRPESVILRQNASRTHKVPVEVIKEQISLFQLPDIDESHAISFIK